MSDASNSPPDASNSPTSPGGHKVDVIAMLKASLGPGGEAEQAELALAHLRGQLDQEKVDEMRASAPVARVVGVVRALVAEVEAEAAALNLLPEPLRRALEEVKLAADVVDGMMEAAGV